MKKSMILIVMAVLCLFLRVHAQSSTTQKNENVKPLLIGDKVPDLEFLDAPNVAGGKLKFSDFKGKALILDFWGTWCGACISGFPHVEEIQKKYRKYLQVILIADSGEGSASVSAFLEKRKKNGEEIKLPVVISKLTKKLFDHNHYPHYVWVGADRRIKAITKANELEDESIKRLIAGLDLHLPIKLP